MRPIYDKPMSSAKSVVIPIKRASLLTQKYQITIPKEIREKLGLEAGDIVVFEEGPDEEIRIRKVTSLDVEFTAALEDTLSEWHSDCDEEAYRDL